MSFVREKFVGNFLLELIYLLTIIAIVSTPLDGFNYCYITVINLFDISHLFAK